MMGKLLFTERRDSVTTRSMGITQQPVVVCLNNFQNKSPMKGQITLPNRRSPGRPAVSARSAERNGALSTYALSRWYNEFTARPLLHL